MKTNELLYCPKCQEKVTPSETGECPSCGEVSPPEDYSSVSNKGVYGCMVFVGVLVGTAIILVMRMYIGEHGFWKALLYTLATFAVIAFLAAGKMLLKRW